ncbi:MAG: efflux RND transporter permease subunit [Desulfobacterium sp.]|nr:efflux RND transporter permease subunit [Desulfobacterium sp.]
MEGLTRWFVNNPVAANLIVLLVLAGGLLSLGTLGIEGFPTIAPNSLTIDVSCPGASALEVDGGVTQWVEQSLEGVPGIKKISSLSFEDASQVTVEKTVDYDMMRLMSDVKTRVDGISNLVERAKTPVITLNEFKDHALIVQVYGQTDEKSLQQAGRRVKDALLAHAEIARVVSHGEKNPEIRLEVDRSRLRALGTTLGDIIAVFKENSFTYRSGNLKSDDGTIMIRVGSQARTVEDLLKIPLVSARDGSRIMLKDAVSIVDGFEADDFFSLYQGKPSLGFIVYTGKSSRIMDVSAAAHAVVDQLSKELPSTIRLDIWADMSTYMTQRLTLLSSNAWQGLLIVWGILAVFLSFRLAFWVAAGIPFSIAGALMMMNHRFLDYTLNDITTFGFIIVLGILVDDAVVVGESIFEEKRNAVDPVEATVKGVTRVSTATVFGVMTTMAAFYPLMLMKNELGQILAGFSGVIMVTLVFSLLESKLVLPAHLARLSLDDAGGSSRTLNPWKRFQAMMSNLLDAFNRRIYAPVLKRSLAHRYTSLVVFVSLAMAGVWLVASGNVKSVFFPSIPGDMITVNLEMNVGSSPGLLKEIVLSIQADAEALNREIMDETHTTEAPFRRIMASVTSGEGAEVYAELQPQDGRVISTLALVDRWRQRVGTVEGASRLTFSGSAEMGGGFSLEIRSRDEHALAHAVDRITAHLKRLPGVFDVHDGLKPGNPEVMIQVKARARHLGLTPREIAVQLGNQFGGIEADRFQRRGNEVKTVFRLPPHQRDTLSELKKTSIRTGQGDLVPLSSVADLVPQYAVSYISRIDGARSVSVGASLDKNRITPEQVVEGLIPVMAEINRIYPDLTLGVEGELEETGTMKKGLVSALLLILLLIYALLAVPLKSYWKPLIIMGVIPFGFAGAVAGHLIAGVPLSLLSFFGMLALAGIVVNDSLVMVTRFNRLMDTGACLDTAIMASGTSRFRAIFLTTATTVCGLIPLLSETSEQAQYLIPAAVSLAWGEMFATFITLILVPVLLGIAYDIKGVAGAILSRPRRPSPSI